MATTQIKPRTPVGWVRWVGPNSCQNANSVGGKPLSENYTLFVGQWAPVYEPEDLKLFNKKDSYEISKGKSMPKPGAKIKQEEETEKVEYHGIPLETPAGG